MIKKSWIVILIINGFMYMFFGLFSAWAEEEPHEGVRRIAVMPFFKGEEPADVEAILSCTLDQFCPQDADVMQGGEKIVTDAVWKAIQKKYNDQTVSQDESWVVFSRIKTDESSLTPRKLAVNFGRELNADHVILGNIWRFKESDIDQKKPGSVAFSTYLLNVDTGRRIWRFRYDSSKHSSIRKFGDFFKQGQTPSAEKLTRMGVQDMMKEFPKPEFILRHMAEESSPNN